MGSIVVRGAREKCEERGGSGYIVCIVVRGGSSVVVAG